MIWEHLKDALWPRTCPVRDCARLSDVPGRHLCSRCRASLPWYREYAKSALAYLEPLPQLINSFKFRDAVWLAEDFADLLEESFRSKFDVSSVDVVMPVPLHPRRMRTRGYNQSELLAAALARRFDRLCDSTSIARIRDTEHQSRLSGNERRKNVQGAFKAVDPSRIRGRTVLLVDDVTTTGSTLVECERVLSENGAFRVYPFALAKALTDEDVDGDMVRAGRETWKSHQRKDSLSPMV